MYKNELAYLATLKEIVYKKIDETINPNTICSIIEFDLFKSHIENKISAGFQDYYFRTLNNQSDFLYSDNFFRQFKKRYSLQGIDNVYLDKLETQKVVILNLITSDNITKLYFDTFNKAQIKYGNKIIEKDLGSFFAKLVHTFQPDKYCALDNPIKNYFGLQRESFFLAFSIISEVYKSWTINNSELILNIRTEFQKLDKSLVLNHKLLTNHKLLDLIYWSKANR